MARVRGSDFGETVLAVRADDSELRATLAKDEAFVRQSTEKMQGSLNKLNVPLKTVGTTAVTTSSKFALLAAAGGIVGGSFGPLIGQTAMMGSAITSLGKAAALTALRFSALALPIAITIGFFVREFGKVAAANRAAEEALATTEAKVGPALARQKKRIADLAMAEAAAAKALQEASRAAALIVSDRIRDLQRELQILDGRAKATDFITNALERQLTVQRDLVITQQESARLAEFEKQAHAATISAQGPQTRPEAQAAISQLLLLFNAEQRGLFETRKLVQELVRTGRLDPDELRFINARAGLGFGGASERAELASAAGGLGIPATRFTDIRAFGGGVDDPAAKRDEARNKKLDTLILLQRRGTTLN
ncbi:MAG TPA: hypothetical protein ENH55_01410 [Aurantimonas coralicida]|uniref:Uncharacterized protein n=1 Tax=marine sediment metagenome TaxID=412755 RepID=A0A0F9PHW7_9ZZZZ|nr:hypothetical protein [Aurantimonas coralicida]